MDPLVQRVVRRKKAAQPTVSIGRCTTGSRFAGIEGTQKRVAVKVLQRRCVAKGVDVEDVHVREDRLKDMSVASGALQGRCS